ncbi:MAG: Gfo/Idh/MocA family oxidoreductase [Planctomycetota bacterium]
MSVAASTDRRVRVAIVGAGDQANFAHYPSLASMSDVELAAICDINPARLQATAAKYAIAKRYGADRDPLAYRKMVEDVAPEAIYVIGLPNIMYDLWVWCLTQGLNLFIEKPMGVNLHSARNLARLAEKHGCITQVGFQRRATPMIVKLREECLKRGPIFHACCVFFKCSLVPYTDLRDRLIDDGIHAVDTIRWMCGGEALKVHSVMQSVGVPDNNTVSALIEFSTGAVGVMVTTWASGRRIFKVEMHSPGVWVDAEHEGKGILYANGDTQGVVHDAKEIAGGSEIWRYAGFLAKHREFIDGVKTKTPPGSNFSDAVKTMELAEKIVAMGILAGR